MSVLNVTNGPKRDFTTFKNSISRNYELYLMITPVVLYFIIFAYIPIFGIQIAFKNYMPGMDMFKIPWVGFIHFERFFNSYYFGRLIRNTVGISLYSMLVGIPAPIILAVMFNEMKNRFLRTASQTISYIPAFLSVTVIVSIFLFFLSPTDGTINGIIKIFGMKPVNFLAEPSWFWHIYVLTGLWQGIGWGSVIYTATISGIPAEHYEAATIDGASRLQRIWHVTIPGILPTIIIISILNAGNILNVGFEKIFLLQNSLNQETSEVIATYVYKSGLRGAQFSLATAINLFNNVINFALLSIVNSIAKRLGETSLW